MTTLSITVEDQSVRSHLAHARKAIQDMRPMLKDIGSGLVSNIQQSLGRGMTPWGAAMKPLKYRKGVPLNDTRQHIYNRITHRLTGSNAVEVGMLDSKTEPIGRLHQYGGKRQWGGHQVYIPARPFLPIRAGRVDLPDAWRDEILDQIRSHIEKALRP